MTILNISLTSRIFAVCVLFFSCFDLHSHVVASDESKSIIPIGVVLDMGSPLGSMADMCMKMAISDFYSAHPNYTTRLKLHAKNVNTVLDANLAALELLKQEDVHGIIGPQVSSEELFFTQLGQKLHIPIISFTAKSSTTSYTQNNNYFLRTTPDDSVQAKAIATICMGFEWSEVAVIYEDTDYGNQFLSRAIKAFQEVEIGLAYMVSISESAEDSDLLKELNKLSKKQTRVFLVHMNPSLGFRLFNLAKGAGFMSEGYAWIITDSLSSFISSMDFETRDSMEGVLGVRPYISRSKELEGFQERWKRNKVMENLDMELNIYGLWAYDAITALAIAVEKIDMKNHMNTTINGTYKMTFGHALLDELSRTKFKGLSGDFQLVDRKLNQSTFEILNVIGNGEKIVGFWIPDRGITRDLSSNGDKNYSSTTKNLKNIIWPGDSVTRPKGWAIPTTGKLRVGIPWKHGFTEFVDVTTDPSRKYTNATGFSIDIFLDTLQALPFSIDYEFRDYNDSHNINWSYDDMLHKIPEIFDIVVGDTTIWAPRATYVDFSLPYSESGVVLVVKNKKPFDMWIFIKPLRWDLWLAIILACILMGIVLRILERRVTMNDTDSMRAQNRLPAMAYWSPVTVLAFPERNMVSNNWSFIVLIFWVFMAFILMQSYTANLSAILTVDQLKFAFSDNYYVGCQDGSFMKEFLIEQLHISESRLRSYSSTDEYHKAMALGSDKGGIDAIFDEIPYMKLLINKYDSQYKMVGPTYKTGGFSFAFPIGSPLVSHFSKAILDITQGANMTAIEQKNFGPGYSSQDPLSSTISQHTSSLTLFEFAGLFLIIGSVTILALFCSETPIGRKITDKTACFIRHYFNSKASKIESLEDSSTIDEDSIQSGVEEMHEIVQDDGNLHSHEEGINEHGIENVDQSIGIRGDSNREMSS